jgi:hypothetical protein
MKKILLSFFICFAFVANASTSITTPTVSGHWTLAGSPYLIYNDITINSGTSLIIDPGVEVIVQGHYVITVYGGICAIGSDSQYINFHVQDTTGWSVDTSDAGGWIGIDLRNGVPADSSSFRYCNIYDLKNGGISCYNTNIIISNCNLYHNSSCVLASSSSDTLINSFELSTCNIHDNKSTVTSVICSFSFVNINIHGCQFYNNITQADMTWIYYCDILFLNNQLYQNVQLDTSNVATLEIHNSTVLVQGNKIHHNISLYDGALSLYDCNADIIRNLICNNQSALSGSGGLTCSIIQGGGGIRLTAYDDTFDVCHSTIRDNIITNNDAEYAGSAIYIYSANALIANNQVVNNTSNNAAIFIYNYSPMFGHRSVVMKNNLLYNNITGSDTFNISIEEGDTIDYDHNWTQVPFTADISHMGYSYTVLTGDTLTNIIGTDPGMIAPTLIPGITDSALTANFALLATSPCINMGDTSGADPDSVDYAGNPRTYGAYIDIGAFESIHSPGTLNTVNIPKSQKTIEVYPNPAVNLIFVSTTTAGGALTIKDISGNIIAQKQVTGTLTSFDIHSLPRGIYFAIWNDGSGAKSVQKFVVE